MGKDININFLKFIIIRCYKKFLSGIFFKHAPDLVIGEIIDKIKVHISVRTIHEAGYIFEENVETEILCSPAMKIYNYIGLVLKEIKSLSPFNSHFELDSKE